MFKKKVYEDFVDLSIGRVYIRPLTNRVFNKALKISGVIENAVNNFAFLNYVERKMTCIPFWKWGSLTINDGNVLRKKIIEMLKKDDIVTDKPVAEKTTDEANLWANVSAEDKKWFKNVEEHQKRKMGLM